MLITAIFLALLLLLTTLARRLFPQTRPGRSYYIAKAMNGSKRYPMGKMTWLNPAATEQEGTQLSVLGDFELKRVDPDGREYHFKTLRGWVNLDLTAKGKPALDQDLLSLATTGPLQHLEFVTTAGELHYLSFTTSSGTRATVGIDVLL